MILPTASLLYMTIKGRKERKRRKESCSSGSFATLFEILCFDTIILLLSLMILVAIGVVS